MIRDQWYDWSTNPSTQSNQGEENKTKNKTDNVLLACMWTDSDCWLIQSRRRRGKRHCSKRQAANSSAAVLSIRRRPEDQRERLSATLDTLHTAKEKRHKTEVPHKSNTAVSHIIQNNPRYCTLRCCLYDGHIKCCCCCMDEMWSPAQQSCSRTLLRADHYNRSTTKQASSPIVRKWWWEIEVDFVWTCSVGCRLQAARSARPSENSTKNSYRKTKNFKRFVWSRGPHSPFWGAPA